MEKFYSNIIGTPVFADDSTRPFTTVKDIIIDPERGNLLALVVNITKKKVIAPVDIISWRNVIKVHNGNSVADGKDILRVDEVQKNNIRYMGNKVETETGRSLGKVFDLAIDSDTLELKKIFAAKGVLSFFRYDTRIIGVKSILDVKEDKIIVKSGLKTVKEEAKQKVSVKDMAVG
ncbi:hypothetical protein GF366_00595 [Candidatus Peregrinibacteria bacterium]|nr:hypothetical protein [Candidatus Peregrinibacteria bacterium]